MLYSKEFYPKRNPNTGNVNTASIKVFSVILNSPDKKQNGYGRYSIINSIKLLSYYTAIFGNQIVRYKKKEIHEMSARNKMYSVFVIAMFISQSFVTPKSWKDTISDVPLNILTKCFGYLVTIEVNYLVFIATFCNGGLYYKLIKKLDNFDQHFVPSKKLLTKIRVVTICFIIITILEVAGTFFLRTFNVYNLGVHFLLYLLILQGAIIIFFFENIYSRQLVFNQLLFNKIFSSLPKHKASIYKTSLEDKLILKIFADSQTVQQKLCSHYSWFELMQMYDKIADCVYLFNKIYAGQVFIMFQTFLFCTMLTICRYLSPTLKNLDVTVSDLYTYSCINMRPMYWVKMCEMLSKQKKKTLSMLMNILVHGDLDEAYFDQVQTMIDLVGTRKIELTASVFTADLHTALNFFGPVISYTVIMIQYFYKHVYYE